jgi:hypothetical protein
VLGNSANLLDVRLDICGNEWAVSTHPALKVDKMIGMADTADALGHLFSLQGEALMLTPGRFEHLFGLLQAHGRLWRAARTAFFGLVARALLVGLRLFELFPCFADDLVGGPLFGGHRRGDRLAEFMLDMEQVRRVVCFEIMFHIGQ